MYALFKSVSLHEQNSKLVEQTVYKEIKRITEIDEKIKIISVLLVSDTWKQHFIL
jgi:hypothetical protein